MKYTKYKVILTNGALKNEYEILALNEEQAIILAQAEAINKGRGYKFVDITEVEE